MGNNGVVYFVELQAALSATGLNVCLAIPVQSGPWFGTIDEKPFTMSISSGNEKDGIRDFMILTLCGQDEEVVISKFADFIGYKPFCKYQDKRNSDVTSATLEWSRSNATEEFAKLEKDENIFDLKKLEDGFNVSIVVDMTKYYQKFTSEVIQAWEEAVGKKEELEFSGYRIKHLLPFLKKVIPRIGKNQSFFGLSLISLNGRQPQEKEIVEYGLEPLLLSQVISTDDATRIVDWYRETEPTWDSGCGARIKIAFEIGEVKYELTTDSYRNCRDLNLNVI